MKLTTEEINGLPEARNLRYCALKYAADRKADLWRQEAEEKLYEAAVALATALVRES